MPQPAAVLAANASAGGKASAIARRQAMARDARRQEIMNRVLDGAAELIPDLAYTAAVACMAQVLENGDLPMDTQLDRQRAAETSKTLFTIARLASGESTSNVAHATVDPAQLEAIAERVAKLRGNATS